MNSLAHGINVIEVSEIDSQGDLPFRILEVPKYREMSSADWTLKRVPMPPFGAAYFPGLRRCPSQPYALFKGDTVWMSTAPMELESLAPQLDLATGDVVVMGLGMGALVYNLLKKPHVKTIRVVEADPNIVAIMTVAAPWFFEACQSGRVTIDIQDARKWRTAYAIDALLIDIWPIVGDRKLRADTRRIFKNNPQAARVHAWGQETEFAMSVMDRMVELAMRGRAGVEFLKSIGPREWDDYCIHQVCAPLAGEAQWPGYVRLCIESVLFQIMGIPSLDVFEQMTEG